MFKVVEFDNTSDDEGGLSVVREEWLTPRKKECFWPPCKLISKFNKYLTTGVEPTDNWEVYKVKRIFYETDDLIKARKKCRAAETDSEILTDAEDLRKRKKRSRLICESEDSEKEIENDFNINYPVPPPKKRIEELQTRSLIGTSQDSDSGDVTLCASPSVSKGYQNLPAVPSCSSEVVEQIFPSSPSVSSISLTRPLSSNSTNPYSSINIAAALEIISKHLSEIKTELKDLKETQNVIIQRLHLTSSSIAPSLPDEIIQILPLNSIQDLYEIETYLEVVENRETLENHLSYIGGNKTSNIIRRILEKLFTNKLAITCNWTGKNNKLKLKDLELIKVIIGAVRKNKPSEHATNSDVADVITSWFRFAKDRDGGREKRRNSTQNI